MIGQPAPHILLLNPEPAALTSLQALKARKKPLKAGFLQHMAASTAQGQSWSLWMRLMVHTEQWRNQNLSPP